MSFANCEQQPGKRTLRSSFQPLLTGQGSQPLLHLLTGQRFDRHHFIPRGMPSDYLHPAFGKAQCLGQQVHHCGVGLARDGRGRDPKVKNIVPEAHYLSAGRSGLDFDLDVGNGRYPFGHVNLTVSAKSADAMRMGDAGNRGCLIY